MGEEINLITVFRKFQIIGIILAFLTLSSAFYFTYINEQDDFLKGIATMKVSYVYKLQNEGPINLTSVNIRLAILKSWDPVQEVTGVKIHSSPNQTYVDEYNNTYAQYEYQNFLANQSINLRFDANLTLNLLDYTGFNFNIHPYDTNKTLYKLFTRYNQLADTTDLATIGVASELAKTNNPLEIAYNAYNFTASYLQYRLLANARGSSFALRNGYGDCDEFTDLFMALVRSAGIPSVEHTAWLADFTEGFSTTDEGSAAHAYPMFFLEGYGMLPVDPTRGHTDIFGNWLKTDEKRITLTRGPDQPYRSLVYRWVPIEGVADPIVVSNYTITINSMNIEYFSKIRTMIYAVLVGMPVIFALYSLYKGYTTRKLNKIKISKMLDPRYE